MNKYDITQDRQNVIADNNLKFMDTKYKFYYDETNNPRVFRFNPKKSKFNSSINDNFILGGIVLKSKPVTSPDIFLQKLHLQANSKEFKFIHVVGKKYKSDFINNLNSENLRYLLTWLDENNIFIHFKNFDNLYWTFVDIIESLPSIPTSLYSNIKDVLYRYLKQDMPFISSIMQNYNYPNIPKESLPAFFDKLINWCENLKCNTESDFFFITILIQSLKTSKKENTLIFLENNKDNILVNDYSLMYINNVYMFINSEHIFDRETEVEKIIDKIDLIYNNNLISNFTFEDSENNFYIQVSDVIVGLLGKFFTFLNQHTLCEINHSFNSLNTTQSNNFALFSKIMYKSIDENEAFFHHITASSELYKFSQIFEF